MSVVVLAASGRAESVALTSALEAGLGSVHATTEAAEAARLLADDGRALLVADLRDGQALGRADAQRLRQQCPGLRMAALVASSQAVPPDCDAVFVEPFFLEDVVRWCARTSVAPLAEGILEDLGAGLSHEIGNPLTSLFLQLELLKVEIQEESARSHLAQIEEAARRIQTVVHDVVQSSRRPPVAATPCSSSALLERVNELLAARDAALAGRVEFNVPERPLSLDIDVLAQALADVWEYLLRAGNEDSTLQVSGADRAPAAFVLSHQARTPRLPPDAASRLFIPLWARMALGLPGAISLTSARGALLRHQGDLRARLLPDGQLLVEAQLPTEAQGQLPFLGAPP
ncbi:MAG: hypothetical protein DHS20C15_00760 [Planctomycetota bacterium]|nr:MAG: hypothetical protein DHS20C15_00760 [Planctomycetota bacterium]